MNLLSPKFYRTQADAALASLNAYYRPLFRAGSVTPLWHGMAAVSIIMYTATQLAHKQNMVQKKRLIEKEAMKEYIEKHGDPFHH